MPKSPEREQPGNENLPFPVSELAVRRSLTRVLGDGVRTDSIKYDRYQDQLQAGEQFVWESLLMMDALRTKQTGEHQSGPYASGFMHFHAAAKEQTRRKNATPLLVSKNYAAHVVFDDIRRHAPDPEKIMTTLRQIFFNRMSRVEWNDAATSINFKLQQFEAARNLDEEAKVLIFDEKAVENRAALEDLENATRQGLEERRDAFKESEKPFMRVMFLRWKRYHPALGEYELLGAVDCKAMLTFAIQDASQSK